MGLREAEFESTFTDGVGELSWHSAGLRQPDVSRLESGGGTPTIGMLERLAHALELRFVARFERPGAA